MLKNLSYPGKVQFIPNIYTIPIPNYVKYIKISYLIFSNNFKTTLKVLINISKYFVTLIYKRFRGGNETILKASEI